MLADFLTGSITSQPPLTVAVWAKASLFIHSMVSPTLALISAGENANFSIVTVSVSAFAEIGPREQSKSPSAGSPTVDIVTSPVISVPSQHARHAVGDPGIS